MGRKVGIEGKVGPERLRDALLELEPELRTIDGLLTACRILGEAADHLEPEAVGTIARCASEALERVMVTWRAALGQMQESGVEKER